MKKICVIIVVVFLCTGCSAVAPTQKVSSGEDVANIADGITLEESLGNDLGHVVKSVNFQEMDDSFFFSGHIPEGWEVEHVPETDALNIYNPSFDAANSLEQSQSLYGFRGG